MSNMSYCRFENTYPDLRDCTEAIESFDPLSEREARFAREMYDQCKEFIAAFDENGINNEDEDEDDDS